MIEPHTSGSPKFASLPEWLTWQESLHVTEVELGLERCRKVATALGVHRPNTTVVTVAGTNGKGSSVAMLDAIFSAAGYRVGTYTSPHLLSYNERIQFNGRPVSDEKICAAFELIEGVRESTPLTYFEFGTLAALVIFDDLAPDVVILEVGLGGRLDAVNIVDPNVALITSIAIDHIEYLGDTREVIALEKAGIMRPTVPTVCSDRDVPATLRDHARSLPAPLHIVGEHYRFSDNGESWSWWSGEHIVSNLPRPNLDGAYQLRNAAGVLKVLDILGETLPVSDSELAEGLKQVSLAGRFQVINAPIETIVDVAHNAQAAEVFVETLMQLEPVPRTHIVLGMLAVKDRDSVIRSLARVADVWHLATVVGRRGATSDALYESLRRVVGKKQHAYAYDSVGDAYSRCLEIASPGDRIVALGSFLVAAEVIEVARGRAALIKEVAV